MAAFQLLAKRDCAPEMDLIWQPFGSRPQDWAIRSAVFTEFWAIAQIWPARRFGKSNEVLHLRWLFYA